MEKTKREVTAGDLQNHPVLGEKGVKEGDQHEFAEDGSPVFELENNSGNSSTAEPRVVTAEDLEKYPQLTELGAKEGDEWNAEWTF